MACKGMLTVVAGALLLGGWLCAGVASTASAEEPDRLESLTGVTAGRFDHYQGELAGDQLTLFFISKANSTAEVHRQHLVQNAPELVFDDNADVSHPRVSPDGTTLLYISYQENTGGDVCLYQLQERRRRCLTQEGTEALDVFWFPDSRHVGALLRSGLLDMRELRKMPVGQARGDQGELVLRQNIASPALSPDGQWLVYVRLDQDADRRLSFITQAAPGFALHRVDGRDAVQQYVPDMPGASGFPAFSPDGRYLYFTQFLNDTNFDGHIDGNDNGILFRARFEGDRPLPIQKGSYEQLTSGRSNCQYPAPAQDRLIATCARGGYLQIYSLPPTGLVPREWSPDRIEAEIPAARDPWQRLLLLKRLLAEPGDPERKTGVLRRIIVEHLALHEYESAEYHLRQLQQVDRAQGFVSGWVSVLQELVNFRREEQRLPHGKVSAEFAKRQTARQARLQELLTRLPPDLKPLAMLAAGEIVDVLGDKDRALRMTDIVDLRQVNDALTLHVIALQQEKFLRLLDERERVLRLYRQLSDHPALSERDRLRYADAYRRQVLSGRPRSEHSALVTARLREARPGSALAWLLEAERVVLATTPETQRSSLERVAALLQTTGSFERRRAVTLRVIDAAAHGDYEQVLYEMGKVWLATVQAGHPERKHAEAILADIVLERAYVELSAGRLGSAADLFDEVIWQTRSLEAHEGYLEAKLRAGESWQTLLAASEARFADQPKAPELAFIRAYLRGQRLSELSDLKRHRAEVEQDMAILAPAVTALPRSPEVHHLYGYLAHREFHHSGDKRMAMIAHSRYYLALDLAPRNVRRKAALLHELGLLQAALGNHHLALLHLDERERLPFLHPSAELSFRLAKARSHYHRGQDADAGANIDAALALVSQHPSLSKYQILVLDRAAFYQYVGQQYEKAFEDYAALLPVIAGESLAERLKGAIGLGATALRLERYPEAVEALAQAQRLLESREPMRRTEPAGAIAVRLTKADYRPIVDGLLAQAYRGNGDHEAALTHFRARRASLRLLWRDRGLETYLHDAAAASHQMAYSALQLGRVQDAVTYLEEGLRGAAEYRTRSGADVDEVTVALLAASLELHLAGAVPVTAWSFDLPTAVHQAFTAMNRNPNPRWRHQNALFTWYLTGVDLDRRRTVPTSETSELLHHVPDERSIVNLPPTPYSGGFWAASGGVALDGLNPTQGGLLSGFKGFSPGGQGWACDGDDGILSSGVVISPTQGACMSAGGFGDIYRTSDWSNGVSAVTGGGEPGPVSSALGGFEGAADPLRMTRQ